MIYQRFDAPALVVDLTSGVAASIVENTSIQSVIDKLGEPNYVIYSPYTSHGNGCMADLDWQEMNIFVRIIDSNVQLCNEIQIGEALDPNIEVTEVYHLVKEAFIPNQCQEYNCVPWPGFKKKQ